MRGQLTICGRTKDDFVSDVYIDTEKVGACRPAPTRTLCPTTIALWGAVIAEDTPGGVFLWHLLDKPVCYQCDWAASDALRAMRTHYQEVTPHA